MPEECLMAHNSMHLIIFFTNFLDDSVYNNINYTKLYYSQKSEPYNWELNSLWREDEVGNIYIKQRNINEHVIYNFNLNEGDYLLIQDEIINIDSTRVQLFGNVLKKYIYAHPKPNPDHIITWIDGVGSLCSPDVYDGMYLVGVSNTLICFEEKGEHIYLNPAYTACDANTGTAVERLQEKPKLIEVIPFGNETIQINSNNFSREIIFYTIEGKQILKQKIREL